jgi:hypothetical protein
VADYVELHYTACLYGLPLDSSRLVLNSIEVCLRDVPVSATASYDPYGSFMPSLCPITSFACGYMIAGSKLRHCAIHIRTKIAVDDC